MKINFLILVLITIVVISLGCIESPPSADLSVSPATVCVGEKVSFSAVGSTDLDGNITSYNWDFSDGNTTTGAMVVNHAYSNKGTYTTKLTVIDNDGLSDTAEVNVTVIWDIIKINVTSSTWRGGEEPYDVYSAIKSKLAEVGFKVVPEESSNYNIVLLVDYKEKKGSAYGWDFLLGTGSTVGCGTIITCNLELRDKENNLLFEKVIEADTPRKVVAGELYGSAVLNFQEEPSFKYLGKIIAIRYAICNDFSILISLLKDEKYPVRESVVLALSEIGDRRSVELLIATLTDESLIVRKSAVLALGEIGDKRAVEPLIAALNDTSEDIRWKAAWALGEIGDKRAVKPLIAALNDTCIGYQYAAAEALGKIGDKRAVEPLIAALNDTSEDVRWKATWALGEIGDKRAVEPLTAALNDEEVFVRIETESALEKIKKSNK